MHVVIAGGGIGGLACAQGLHRAGIRVTVIERDTTIRAAEGYKIHLGPRAVAALEDLLSPEQYQTLLASSVASEGFTIVVRNHRGRQLIRASEPSHGLSLDVDRATLRRILARGVEHVTLSGRSCSGWQTHGTTVTVHCDDGAVHQADLLVIADGAASPLAQQLAGDPTSSPCGLTGVAGRTPWSTVSERTKTLLGTEPMLALGPGGTGMFASLHDPVSRAAVKVTPSMAVTTEPVVIWGLIALEGSLPPNPHRLSTAELAGAAGALLQSHRWVEAFADLPVLSEPDSVAAFRFHAADPSALAPWPSGRVTGLGDAVHAMPPTGGQGAATAILDAHVFTRQLSTAVRNCTSVTAAVADFENLMRIQAAPAVRESLQPLRWIRTAASPWGGAAFRVLSTLMVAGSWSSAGVRRTTEILHLRRRRPEKRVRT